jgi:glycine cleavage system transcriptional repressor
MPSLAVTVIGRDRPGIIAEVTGVLAGLGGNLEDSSMTLLRGHFAWTLIVDIDVSADELAARLAHLRRRRTWSSPCCRSDPRSRTPVSRVTS